MRQIATSMTRRLGWGLSTKKAITPFEMSPFPLSDNPNSLVPKRPDLKKIEEDAYVQYRKYPYLPHQDPKSKAYIEAPLDEYHDRVEAEAFNTVIDQLKHDLQLQREIWDAIEKLDRPYKKGVPGVDTNLPGGPKHVKLPDLGFERRDILEYDVSTFQNEDSFIANTPYEENWKPSNILEWEQEYRNRPVTRHFNHAKGYKYDVPVKPEEKYEFLADRLGHPELFGSAIERLLKLENDIYHPEYIDQPFVKTPSNKPDPSLNFEEGEVLYENTRLLEWLKFWQATIFTGAAYSVLFVPYQLVFKTHMHTPMADEIFPFMPYHACSPYNMDSYHIGIPFVAGIAGYAVYLVLNVVNRLTRNYIVKMSYSKDKELVFVKTIDLYGAIEQTVYETAHLEILPPSVRSGVGHLSAVDKDGITTVTCMNTQTELLFYNNKKYWNPNLRKEFFFNHLNMWDRSYHGYNRPEKEQQKQHWEEYLNESLVAKKELPK